MTSQRAKNCLNAQAWHNNGFHPRIKKEKRKKLGYLWRFIGKNNFGILAVGQAKPCMIRACKKCNAVESIIGVNNCRNVCFNILHASKLQFSLRIYKRG